MKICQYCGTYMNGEYETNSYNFNRRKGYYNCPKCGALCDDDVIEKKGVKTIISEKWISPYKDDEKNEK